MNTVSYNLGTLKRSYLALSRVLMLAMSFRVSFRSVVMSFRSVVMSFRSVVTSV